MQLHPVFSAFEMLKLDIANFDAEIEKAPEGLTVVFFWGHQCPNCEVAKRNLYEYRDEYHSFPIRWLHVNTYEQPDLGTRFGLHGIPTFLFFKRGRVLARATSYPGHEEFKNILQSAVVKWT